ncbi:MAG: ABC transporter permease [Bacillota bacterium]|jgi:peptide/nickel transport system permease protein|nr:ABC transporter permease [Bacillota bacterium]HHT89591.1 ABC transporter permease [Bacillota bacterium]
MVMKKLLRNPLSMIGLILLLGFVLVAIFAPWIAPTPENNKNDPFRVPRYGWGSNPEPPSKAHPMGLTQGKYDIFYGIVWGTRTAFQVGLIVTGLACLVGVIIGSTSAYIGGKFDEVVMRFVDVFMSFPFLIAAIVITAILGRGLDKVIFALVIFRWTGYARLIRGSVLQVKEEEYVMAARAGGVSHPKIVTRHVLPNTIFPVLIQASMNMGSIVVTASTLSFLGLGAPEGYADWGQMISFARNWILGTPDNPLTYWYTVIWPGLAIVLFVLSWNLIGDAFRDIMDPRIQG